MPSPPNLFVGLIALLLGCGGELATFGRGSARDGGSGPSITLDGGTGTGTGDGGDGGDPGMKPPPTAPTCEIERGDVTRVFFGTLTPTHLAMTPGQILAIGKIDTGGSWCSGLVIHPRWVLTASHCTEGTSASSMQVHFGAKADAPDVAIGVARIVDNPQADQALLELAEDATSALPSLTPVRLFTGSLTDDWIRRTGEAAGYGRQEDGTLGTRKFTAEPIVAIGSDSVTIDGEGRHGVCFGDSGGPLMVRADDGSVRVIGNLSGGDESCTGRDNFTRVDVFRSFIEGYTGPTAPVDGAGCGTVTSEGRCMDGSALWCAPGDTLQSQRCENGAVCGWDAAQAGFRCVPGSTDPCMGIDRYGRCDGTVARYCDRGTLRNVDCASCGEQCADNPAAGGVVCQADPCAGLDYLGRCNGAVSEWCDDGVFKTKDCAADGKTCGYVNAELGYFCM